MILSSLDYEARVRERAEQLWEEAGRPEGKDQHFWYEAQRALEAEHFETAPEDADDLQRSEADEPAVH